MTAYDNKKTKVIVIVILILLLAAGLLFFAGKKDQEEKPPAPEPVQETVVPEEPSEEAADEVTAEVSQPEPEEIISPNIVEELPVLNLKNITAGKLSDNEYQIIVRFGFDKSELDTATQDHFIKTLKRVSENSDLIVKIAIEGHTDSIGPSAYNDKLSKRRALTAYKTVSAQIIMDDIETDQEYSGETHPVSDNDTKEGRALNRRSEMVFSFR